MSVSDARKRYAEAGKRIEQGEWIDFEEIGDETVGRVVDFFEVGEKNRRAVRLEMRDGTIRPMGLGGNRETLITDQLKGHVIAVLYVDEMDTGQIQPMKVFEVYDLGNSFPPEAAETA